MANEVSHTSKAQKLAPQISSDHPNPSKFFTHFLYKAALVTVFLVLLPLFPSLAPEFINQTLHARSWELLQLIFVGIAVSYGLFSKKNEETEKDHSSKLDNAQSYVSKLLQVSSVFDDESENQTVIDDNKIQTWNSQYYRGEPVVVVAKESPVVVKEEISQKPLLLPVRSLKQRVSQPNEVDLADESGVRNASVNRSSSCSKKLTSNSRKFTNGELGGLNVQKLEGQLEENVVLRSPIPWRSRSGRMEMKENGDSPVPSFTEDEPEFNRVLESRPSRSFKPNSSPKNLSPSTSFSSESQAKAREDVVRKKTFSSPPPPPPPPPIHRKSMLMKSNSNVTNNAASSDKVLSRSVRSVPAEEPLTRMNPDGLRKSVRTFRSSTDYETKLVKKKALMETSDEESEVESEIDYSGGSPGEATENRVDQKADDVGPDVDKKADEFIAKFREQIRLQRIESIRKSTAQRAGKSLS